MIKRSDISNVIPYANTIDKIELKGRHLYEAMERSVEKYDILLLPGFFLQHTGKYRLNNCFLLLINR